MREIKFRGKNGKGQWVHGGYTKHLDFTPCVYKDKESAEKDIAEHTHYLITEDGFSDYGMPRQIETHEVKPETIGQYTGLKDKNGKEIYEGDIVEAWSEGIKCIGQVKQRIDGLWLIYPAWQYSRFWNFMPNEKGEDLVEVIGNIHDNIELLNDK